MLVAFFTATWLTGLSLATAFAAAAYGFGRHSFERVSTGDAWVVSDASGLAA